MIIFFILLISFFNLLLQIYLKGSTHFYLLSKLQNQKGDFNGEYLWFFLTYKFARYPEVILPIVNFEDSDVLGHILVLKNLRKRNMIYKSSIALFIIMSLFFSLYVIS